jgi:hypothetical protein
MTVSYAELAAEPWWGQETTSPAHEAFNKRLREFFGMGPSQIASKGDNNHLKGRHRSRDWSRNSQYCTDRSYGDRDQRDKTGLGIWLRATDVGISGQPLWDACKRLDAAVRANQLPAVAEWFGTFDGKTVVGWFQGHTSSSDSSHLYHLHVGLWTSACNDVDQIALLGDIITGAGGVDVLTAEDKQWLIDEIHDKIRWGTATPSVVPPGGYPAPSLQTGHQRIDLANTGIDEIKATLAEQGQQLQAIMVALAAGGGGGGSSPAQIAAAVRHELDNTVLAKAPTADTSTGTEATSS